ncbi:ABC transporter permease [Microbacterium pseudoresistens]
MFSGGAHRPPAALLGAISIIAFLLVLEVLPRIGAVDPNLVPPFSEMIAALGRLLMTSLFWESFGATVFGWLLGLAIAVVAGGVLGAAVGSIRRVRDATATTVEFLRPIPSVAFIPLVVILFGTGWFPTFVLVVYASFWQVFVQVVYGAQDVDSVARETAQTYQLNWWMRVRYLTWPTILPYLFIGFRLAATVALIIEITGELIIGSPGLGKQIAIAQQSAATDSMFGLVIVTGLLGVAANILPKVLERSVLRWHPSVRREQSS